MGSDGAELSYYGCTLSIPPGALDEDTEICLEILNTDLPELVVSPILKLEPSNLTFNCPVTVTLPVVISPSQTTPEAEWPQVTLMCCRYKAWNEVYSTQLSYEDLKFQCSHFSAYCYILNEDGKKTTMKRLACLLHKGLLKENQCEVTISICDDLAHVIKVSNIFAPNTALFNKGICGQWGWSECKFVQIFTWFQVLLGISTCK